MSKKNKNKKKAIARKLQNREEERNKKEQEERVGENLDRVESSQSAQARQMYGFDDNESDEDEYDIYQPEPVDENEDELVHFYPGEDYNYAKDVHYDPNNIFHVLVDGNGNAREEIFDNRDREDLIAQVRGPVVNLLPGNFIKNKRENSDTQRIYSRKVQTYKSTFGRQISGSGKNKRKIKGIKSTKKTASQRNIISGDNPNPTVTSSNKLKSKIKKEKLEKGNYQDVWSKY